MPDIYPISVKNAHVSNLEAIFPHHRLVNNCNKPLTLPTNNGAIHTLYQLIKTVMSVAAEAKIGTTFLNTKDALPIRTTLEEL